VPEQSILQSVGPKEAVVEQESLEFINCEATEEVVKSKTILMRSSSQSVSKVFLCIT
jgi:hypothetical protein